MAFVAKLEGSKCYDCFQTIEVGQNVRYDDQDNLVHVLCPEVPLAKLDPTRLTVREQQLMPCGRCGTLHPGDC